MYILTKYKYSLDSEIWPIFLFLQICPSMLKTRCSVTFTCNVHKRLNKYSVYWIETCNNISTWGPTPHKSFPRQQMMPEKCTGQIVPFLWTESLVQSLSLTLLKNIWHFRLKRQSRTHIITQVLCRGLWDINTHLPEHPFTLPFPEGYQRVYYTTISSLGGR